MLLRHASFPIVVHSINAESGRQGQSGLSDEQTCETGDLANVEDSDLDQEQHGNHVTDLSEDQDVYPSTRGPPVSRSGVPVRLAHGEGCALPLSSKLALSLYSAELCTSRQVDLGRLTMVTRDAHHIGPVSQEQLVWHLFGLSKTKEIPTRNPEDAGEGGGEVAHSDVLITSIAVSSALFGIQQRASAWRTALLRSLALHGGQRTCQATCATFYAIHRHFSPDVPFPLALPAVQFLVMRRAG